MGDNSCVCLYADDTDIFVSGQIQESIEILSHVGLSMIKDFLNSKSPLMNSNKCYLIFLSTKQARTKLYPNMFIHEQMIKYKLPSFLAQSLTKICPGRVMWMIGKTFNDLYALRLMVSQRQVQTLIAAICVIRVQSASWSPKRDRCICLFWSAQKKPVAQKPMRPLLNLLGA